MAGRRTNLALLGILATALATGILAFAIGGPWGRWVVTAHGVVGLAIILLAPWKGAIARRGLRRHRPGRTASILLVALVIASVSTGIVHTTGALRPVGFLSPLPLHVASSVAAIVVAIVHVIARPVRARAADLSRRNLLRAGALTVGAAAVYIGLEGSLRVFDLRGARRRETGSHELGSFEPDLMPVTQWFNDEIQRIDPSAWRLDVIEGTAKQIFSFDELDSFSDTLRATVDCTGGWYSEQEWKGVLLSRLMRSEVGSGSSIVVRSATGYSRRFPAGEAGDLLLATRVGGAPLSPGHGSPLRLVAPGRRGFWWVKWVTSVEADDAPWWWQPPFPLT